jgi:hypothetical protein
MMAQAGSKSGMVTCDLKPVLFLEMFSLYQLPSDCALFYFHCIL